MVYNSYEYNFKIISQGERFMKKLISVLMALTLVLSFATVAFAGDGYDYAADEWYLNLQANDVAARANDGDFTWGCEATAFFRIVDLKTYSVNAAKTACVKHGKTYELKDIAYPDYMGYEAVELHPFYVIFCPECGKALGEFSVNKIYSDNSGVCKYCQAPLTAPKAPGADDGLTVYRYIICKDTSAHFQTYKGIDLASNNTLFKDTAAQYGEGKDLPQGYLEFCSYTDGVASYKTEAANLKDAKTSGIVLPTADTLKGKATEGIAAFLTTLKDNPFTDLISDAFDGVIAAALDAAAAVSAAFAVAADAIKLLFEGVNIFSSQAKEAFEDYYFTVYWSVYEILSK